MKHPLSMPAWQAFLLIEAFLVLGVAGGFVVGLLAA